MASGWQSSLLIKNVNCLNQKDQQGKRKYLRIAFESTSQRKLDIWATFSPCTSQPIPEVPGWYQQAWIPSWGDRLAQRHFQMLPPSPDGISGNFRCGVAHVLEAG